MDRYKKLRLKAPILYKDDKSVHLSDFVNDIMYNTSKNFNKEKALEDLEIVIDTIIELSKKEEILEIMKKIFWIGKDGKVYSTFYYSSCITKEDREKIRVWLNNGNN